MIHIPWFVGIDVSKAQLDIALRPEGRFVVPNNETGRAHVIERLQALPVALIVLEATGGLELPLTGALVAAGLPVVVAKPRQGRDFAKATGHSPRPIPLMHRSSPISPTSSGPAPGHCRMRRCRRSLRSLPDVANLSRC